MPLQTSDADRATPLILTLSGMEQPGPGHWLSEWEAGREDIVRAELGMLDQPRRNVCVTALDHAIRQADRPVILVARGLACLAVAWWAALERPAYGDPVVGAMLVAPPNVDAAGRDLRMIGFGPAPKTLLPFPSVVVASHTDPFMDFAGAQALAQFWGSQIVDGGDIGSADYLADLGAWDHGRHVLSWLEEQAALGHGHASKVQRTAQVIGLAPRQRAQFALDMSL